MTLGPGKPILPHMNNGQPWLSVVVPVYRWAAEVLESLPRARLSADEFEVPVDGVSGDGTPEVLDQIVLESRAGGRPINFEFQGGAFGGRNVFQFVKNSALSAALSWGVHGATKSDDSGPAG